MTQRISAVFSRQDQAQDAVNELKTLGLSDQQLSFIARQNGDTATAGTGADMNHDAHDDGKGAARGLAVGVSAGALFGLAAALIPGVGPFITAGFLATSLGAAAGGAVAGAIVGGVTGTLAGALADAGYDRTEAEFYERTINEGGVLVAVDAPDHMNRDQIVDVLRKHGGTMQSSTSADYVGRQDQSQSPLGSGISGQGSLASSMAGNQTANRGDTMGDAADHRATGSHTHLGQVGQNQHDTSHSGRPRLYPLDEMVNTHERDMNGVYNPVGQPVYGSGREQVGTVHQALAQESGRIRYLLVDVGNWASNKIVAVPVGLARIEDDGVYFDTLTRDQVQNLRAYTPGQEFTYDAQLADESTWLHPGNEAHAGTENSALHRHTSESLYQSPTRLQLLEERLFVDKERFVAGSVEVGKRVETRTENVNVDLEREEVVIERHRVTGERPVEGNVTLGSDRESIRVDLEAERADVEKRAYVTEEVEVGKRTETERQSFTETVGKEVLEVNKTGEVDVRADQTATGSLRSSTSDLEDDLNRRSEDSTTQSTLRDDQLGRK